jgi:hypothetical protein
MQHACLIVYMPNMVTEPRSAPCHLPIGATSLPLIDLLNAEQASALDYAIEFGLGGTAKLNGADLATVWAPLPFGSGTP